MSPALIFSTIWHSVLVGHSGLFGFTMACLQGNVHNNLQVWERFLASSHFSGAILGSFSVLGTSAITISAACFSGSCFIKTEIELEILAHDNGEKTDQSRQH